MATNPDAVFTLPARSSDRAPKFNPEEPGTLSRYIEDYLHLAGKAGLDARDKIKRFGMYMSERDSEFIATLPEYSQDNWEEFIAAVYESYPGSKRADRYCMEDLFSLCNVYAVKRIRTRTDFADYDRHFSRIASGLLEQNITAEIELNRHYWSGLDPNLKERLRPRLEHAEPNHHRGVPWDRVKVRKEALRFLEDAPETSYGPGLPGIKAEKTPDPPVVPKVEPQSFEDMMARMAFTMASSFENAFRNMIPPQAPEGRYSRPPPPAFQPPDGLNQHDHGGYSNDARRGGPPGPYRNFPDPNLYPRRGDGVKYGPAGSRPRSGCYMCHDERHLMYDCNIFKDYQAAGKIFKGRDNRWKLGTGEDVPNGPIGTTWKERIDNHYANMAPEKPTGNTGSGNNPNGVVQTNFVTVCGNSEPGTEESMENQAICALRNQVNTLIAEVITVPEYERPGIETTISVLQTRIQKREDELKAKNKAKRKMDLKPAEPQAIRPTGAQPVVEIPRPTKAPQPKPAPPVTIPAHAQKNSGIGPQYRYKAPVENEEVHRKVYDKILEGTVELTIEECLATMNSVRKFFKDDTTSRRVPTDETKNPDPKVGAYMEAKDDAVGHFASASSFAVSTETPVTFEAKPTLPLRCVQLKINDGIDIDGILDSGCQVVLMRKELWQHLRVPLKSQEVITMESANGSRNSTVGLIPRVKFSIGSINLWCPVQVVDGAPFDLLLGRPFFAISQAISRDKYDGDMEITLTDPESGDIITVPTHARLFEPAKSRELNVPARPPSPMHKSADF